MAKAEVKPSLVIVLAILAMVGPFTADMYLPTFPEIATDFGASSAHVQLTLSLFMLGMGVGQLWWGPYSDAIGRRRPLIISTAAFVVISLLAALAPNMFMFILLRFLQGFVGSAGIVIGRAIARDLTTGKELAQMLSVLGVIMGIAPVLAPVIGGLVADTLGWKGIMLVLTGLGVIMAVGTLKFVSESRPPAQRTALSFASYKEALSVVGKDRAFIGLTISGVAAFGSLFAYVSGSSFVLQNEYHISTTHYSLFIGCNALGLLAGGITNSILVSRVSPAKILQYCVVHVPVVNLVSLAVVLAVPNPSPVLWQALIFISTCVTPIIIANTTTLALGPHGKYAGMASAVMGAGQFLMASTVAVLVAVTGNPSSLSVAVVMVIVAIISVLAFWTIVPKRTRTATD